MQNLNKDFQNVNTTLQRAINILNREADRTRYCQVTSVDMEDIQTEIDELTNINDSVKLFGQILRVEAVLENFLSEIKELKTECIDKRNSFCEECDGTGEVRIGVNIDNCPVCSGSGRK